MLYVITSLLLITAVGYGDTCDALTKTVTDVECVFDMADFDFDCLADFDFICPEHVSIDSVLGYVPFKESGKRLWYMTEYMKTEPYVSTNKVTHKSIA